MHSMARRVSSDAQFDSAAVARCTVWVGRCRRKHSLWRSAPHAYGVRMVFHLLGWEASLDGAVENGISLAGMRRGPSPSQQTKYRSQVGLATVRLIPANGIPFSQRRKKLALGGATSHDADAISHRLTRRRQDRGRLTPRRQEGAVSDSQLSPAVESARQLSPGVESVVALAARTRASRLPLRSRPVFARSSSRQRHKGNDLVSIGVSFDMRPIIDQCQQRPYGEGG